MEAACGASLGLSESWVCKTRRGRDLGPSTPSPARDRAGGQTCCGDVAAPSAVRGESSCVAHSLWNVATSVIPKVFFNAS